MFARSLPHWLTPAMLRAAAVMSLATFTISNVVDLTMLKMKINPARTILDDLFIALATAGVLLFYLATTRSEQLFLHAKERIDLTAELNYHLRNALTEARMAAELEDKGQRLERLDHVSEEIDDILLGLAFTTGNGRAKRSSAWQSPESSE